MLPHNNPDNSERRKHPRIFKKLPLELKIDSFDLATETLNISSSGVCCQIDKYLEPMTKVSIVLLLPLKLKNNTVVTKKVSCEGVVVRTEKNPAGNKFNIAVFFSDVPKSDAENINRYIETHLQSDPTHNSGGIRRYSLGAN
jgi:c-di-GMP-binding flagellar brake protein YcgR